MIAIAKIIHQIDPLTPNLSTYQVSVVNSLANKLLLLRVHALVTHMT